MCAGKTRASFRGLASLMKRASKFPRFYEKFAGEYSTSLVHVILSRAAAKNLYYDGQDSLVMTETLRCQERSLRVTKREFYEQRNSR
jgi:hypothetical protein